MNTGKYFSQMTQRQVPPTAMRSSMGRSLSGLVQDGAPRPISAIRGAGFRSSLTRGSTFKPLGQLRGLAPPLEARNEDTPEKKMKLLEKKVNDLIEESYMANANGDLQLALEKAKEAGRKERVLVKQREQSGTADNINSDLTYSVLLNLANHYANNEMYTEALNTYQVIVKKFKNTGQLKVKMADIYFKQKKYPMALKFYRMALDQVPEGCTMMRVKIMQNIGVVFMSMGRYSDAITSFEHIMSESPTIKTGYNLILCYFAIGDRKMMKKSFQKLICVPLGINEEEKYISSNDDPHASLLTEAIKNDPLSQMERERKALVEKYIITSAKLIAPVIESSFVAGIDWCVDMLKGSQYVELASELELSKAVNYLKQGNTNQAVDILKALEKKNSRVKSAAATNLSFVSFLEKDYDQADHYAEVALKADRYNPAALVIKGNILFVKQDYEKAADFFKEALRSDASCTEALYDLGLTYKKLGQLKKALKCFLKLHAILRNSDQVMYQLAELYEMLGDPQQAIEWLLKLISVTPTDPHVLAKLGELYDKEGDKSQAFQYYYESFRYFPSNIHVLEWLGAYYIQTQSYEKAIQFFEKATLVQPNNVAWRLMVASCHRKSGHYQKALETYKDIHRRFPENAECLRFLVRLCKDMGLKEVQDYATKLKKVEKMKKIREQRVMSGRESSARSRREDSGSSDSGQSRHGANPKGERLGVKLSSLPGGHEPYETSSPVDSDASYVDPLGPKMERPKTAAKKRTEEDEFADEGLGDDLLPE